MALQQKLASDVVPFMERWAVYRKHFVAGWGDMDFNAHMRNTAYLDRAADVRMMYLAEHGFPMTELRRLKIGPVIVKDEIEYYREIQLLEEFDADLALAGLAEHGGRFIMVNRFFGPDAKPVAKVTSVGSWLDLTVRKLVPAPPVLLKALSEMPRSEDFKVI